MINVTVLSLTDFKNRYNDLKEDQDIYFISILNPDNKEVFDNDSDRFRTWWFYDLDYDAGSNKTITEEQAKEIADFIFSNKNKKELYVHCSAGVARSGAIGEVVNDFYGVRYEIFKRRNPQVVPNTTVKVAVNKKLYELEYSDNQRLEK